MEVGGSLGLIRVEPYANGCSRSDGKQCCQVWSHSLIEEVELLTQLYSQGTRGTAEIPAQVTHPVSGFHVGSWNSVVGMWQMPESQE